MDKLSKTVAKKQSGLTNNKKRENAEARITRLETAFSQLIQTIQGSFSKVTKDVSDINEAIAYYDRTLQGVIEVLGQKLDSDIKFVDQVTEVVRRNRINELEAESEASAANIKIAVAEGRLTPAASIENDDDIIVTSQKDKNGEKLHPSKVFVTLEQVKPGLKELLKGKKPGDEVTAPEGGVVTVLEVYNIVKKDAA